MKRPELKTVPEGGSVERVETPKMLAKLPHVSELLAQPAWDDGVAKGTRSMFLFAESGVFRILVKVENPPLKLSVVGKSWDDAWAALEAVLRSEDAPWQQDDRPADRTVKKKK